VVVQPSLAAGLLVLMLAGEHMLGERAGRYEYLAMSAILLGMLGAALTAPPRTDTHSEQLTITLVLVGLGLASMLPYLLRALGRSHPLVTMTGAGLALAWALSTAAASGVGVLSEMSALQSRPAIQVAPVVFVTQTVIPVVLAPLLLGESFGATPLAGVPLGCSLALLLVGATMLVRSPLLLGLMEGEPVSESSGPTASEEDSSRATIRSSPRIDAAEPSSSTTSTSPARSLR
jgi:hypothetical protein